MTAKLSHKNKRANKIKEADLTLVMLVGDWLSPENRDAYRCENCQYLLFSPVEQRSIHRPCPACRVISTFHLSNRADEIDRRQKSRKESLGTDLGVRLPHVEDEGRLEDDGR